MPLTPVTRKWVGLQTLKADHLAQSRKQSQAADTSLIIPAAQHPLVEGRRPNKEFEKRLGAGLDQYEQTVSDGGRAKFFLTGNRHHDSNSKQTDQVALYDAGGLWLLERGVPARDLHGLDWINRYNELIYNGADEIRVASLGFLHNPEIRDATYICSPGQKRRANWYALAHGLPAYVQVPESLANGGEQQFHNPNLQMLILDGVTRAVDPYGDWLAKKVSADRIPADGNVGTLPEVLPEYAGLPWYTPSTQES